MPPIHAPAGNAVAGPSSQGNNQPPGPKFPGLSNDDFSKVELNQTPGKTFHSLKPYFDINFRFQTPEQVYRFLSILCSANSQNASWTAQDGQLHLHQLVEGSGIERLADAIRYPKDIDRVWSFQRGYIPIFTYLASDWVIKSTLNSDINALYGLVHHNFQIIRDTVETNMRKLIAARSFKDGLRPFSGKQIFKVLFVALFEYLTRFKEAPATNPGVREFTEQIVTWFDEWLVALGSIPPFQDECTTYDTDKREFIIENLRRDKDRVLRIVRRGQTVITNKEVSISYEILSDVDPGTVAAFERNFNYDGPGELRETGARHDNDFAEMEKIRVAPTRDELLCEDEPYLPPNFFEAPHFHDPRSVERLLDIQFRLLREELTSPIRLAVQLLGEDLKESKDGNTTLSKLFTAKGGRYTSPANSRESVMFSVFTGVTFEPLALSNRGISAGIEFDTPPGKARSDRPGVRAEYWEQVSKKHLMQDGLVALVWRDHVGNVDIYVGTVASSGQDLVEGSRTPDSQERVSIRVSFFDAVANIRIVQALQSRRTSSDTCVLIEAPVFYEGIRPFLEALKREPEHLPFGQYLQLQSKAELARTTIAPPLYSRTPGFSFELHDLFLPEAGVPSLKLNTRDPASIMNARVQLMRASRLDPSQAEAVVDSLTREVALIQGPPGTGKRLQRLAGTDSSTHQEQDHPDSAGSRVTDERLSKYSMETIERGRGESRLGRLGGFVYWQMKTVESQMQALMNDISSHKVPTSHVEQHIASAYPHHYGELFTHVPSWIDDIVPKPGDLNEGWEIAGEVPKQDQSILDFWLRCHDLKFLDTRENKGAEKKAAVEVASFNAFNALLEPDAGGEGAPVTRQSFLRGFMREHGLGSVPTVPDTARPLDDLLGNPRVWRMSQRERATLYEAWSIEASDLTHAGQIENFEVLRQRHVDVSAQHTEIMQQLKAEILSRSDIVGCTTTGAAKYVSMLSGMGPKVMIVEEAGQVLESHILASLVMSVEHVILIGDPLQLRPNINSYKLATDNPKTGKIYKFDQSLMERLSSSGFPMSQIDVQRRMRPEISSLIRSTLYPNLKDNDRVLQYPDVRGMYKNMFFMSHTHKEVDMIYDLVVHLLKQGCYNKPKNIVILAAYLGQIPKLRQRLQGIVTIVIDERDAELLDQQTMDQDETATVQEVQLLEQVTIRLEMLANLQGDEGEVIILSLIRNSGTPFNEETSSLEHVKGRSPIGFLKSLNRTNVGLSRAKHGLYIFGNAPELAQGSQMWSDVLKELRSTESLGPKLPIACHRHPDYIQWIERPGMIPVVSPKGGCLRPCAEALSCGHICPSMCHADNPNHVSTKCQQHCLRLCPRSHPCDRQCWECSTAISDCRFPITDLQLPCGHVHPPIQCYLAITPEKMKCPTRVLKQLPCCSHNRTMPCHQDPASLECLEQVSKELPHCQHRTVLPCSIDPTTHLCQEEVEKELPSCKHRMQMLCHQDPSEVPCPQPVEKKLSCDHLIALPCHQDISEYKCRIEVEKDLPGCSHSAKMICHQNVAKYKCRESVIKSLPVCGHRAQMLCSEDAKAYACSEHVQKRFPNCNHSKQLICHQLRDPVANLCQERLEKELPTCKHRITVPCHEDPTEFKCQQLIERQPDCGHRATMPSPGIDALSPRPGNILLLQGVWGCPSVLLWGVLGTMRRLPQTEPRCNIGSGSRANHNQHACQRRITCGHAWNTTCTEIHVCSTLCKGICQLSCSHSNCRKQCSTPCRPCEEPCIWKCAHEECTSPCGMACTRLPCDKKCPKILSCGHPCPSVCGEPCERQTCKTCSEEDTLTSVVDLLGRIRLRDLDDNATLDTMTITLPCRHVFTVNALDSITRIRDFYEQGSRGEWTKATMPVASAVRCRPICPHCGGGIDSLRYGRILRNSNHSILQHNIAWSLSGQISEAEQLLSKARGGLDQAIVKAVHSYGAARLPSGAASRICREKINLALAADQNAPTNLDIVENLSNFHGFPPRHTKAWRKAVSEVMEPYRMACRVVRESDPSAPVYEGLLACLYQAELNNSGGSTASTTDPEQQRLQQLAAKVAHTRIGHLRPRASDRFTVEAFWVTVEILLLLGLAISKACEAVLQQNVPGANITHWENVAEFLLLRASADAETSHRLANQSKSQSKAILCRLLILQTQYEHTAHRYRAAIRNGSLSDRETRDEFVGICARAVEQIRDMQTNVPREYQERQQRGLLAAATATKVEWVRINFVEPSQKIVDAWNNLTRTIQIEMPERREERTSGAQLVAWEPVVQGYAVSKRVSHTEHFYQCPRGHPYTQGECTIVLGTTWCPECGMTVWNPN
ncbi:hypothetical protein RSAG8_13147, partial [Rhizoctonia solani AG-8 WAC10335]